MDELKKVDNKVAVERSATNTDSSSRATREVEKEDGVDINGTSSDTMSQDQARRVEMSNTSTPQPVHPRPFDSCESKTMGLGKGTYF